MSLILNVGCGTDQYGDVRIDIVTKQQYNKKKNELNLFADAQHLPLRKKVFSETRCFHVLEHLEDPKKAINEINLVTNGIVTLKFPILHRYSLIIEIIYLVTILFNGSLETKKPVIKKVLAWKKRYSDHKYYLKPKKAKINKLYNIPREYEVQYNI